MSARTILNAALAGLTLGTMACSPDISGNPAGPQSDNNGSTGQFAATRDELTAAIKSAFPAPQWVIEPAPEAAYLGISSRLPGTMVLFSIDQVLTNVPLNRGTWSPYIAYFGLDLTPIHTNKTELTVRTLKSYVIDGKVPGPHGGWANRQRQVPPLRSQEAQVLQAVRTRLGQQKLER